MRLIGMKLVTFLVTAVLLMGIFTLAPVVAAENDNGNQGNDEWDVNVNDDVEIVTGVLGDKTDKYYNETKEWDAVGEYVGIRFSKDSWFVITHGTEDNPDVIRMWSIELRYLGGATVDLEDYDFTVEEMGIPVASMYFQALAMMIEFEDTGMPAQNMFFEESKNKTGAGNHLWDLEHRGETLDDLDIKKCEPVNKALHLETAWTRSKIVELTDKKEFRSPSNDREWKFTLTAEDLSYFDDNGKVWDESFEPDGTKNTSLDKLEFTFHIGANAKPVNIKNIPWYDITVSGTKEHELKIKSTKETEAPRDFKGTSITGNFKYDHYIEGWDFSNPESEDAHLMLETISGFGTFIPTIVNDWINTQFLNETMTETETAEYNTPWGKEEVTVNQEIPTSATLIQKEGITFSDSWREVGSTSWVSNVTVDGKDKDMWCQIHAKQPFSREKTYDKDDDKNETGYFSGMILLSGYIYPKGEKIFHDPTYSANALLLDLPILLKFSFLKDEFLLCSVGIAVMAIVVVAVIAVVRKVKTKKD